MPLISVIVPVYKVEPYLQECVDSILNQTFKDFELILVDDGSPDNCPAICDDYAKKDNRVIAIHKENGGLSSARNAGLDYVFAKSNSEYISFVDSDDYVDKIFLEKLYNGIEGCDMCYCNYFSLEDNVILQNLTITKKMIVDNHLIWNVLNNTACLVVAWNKLYKKTIFQNIRYPVGVLQEDEYIIHKVLHTCSNICLIPDSLYYYRKRNNSIVAIKNHEYLLGGMESMIDRAFFFLENKYEFSLFLNAYNVSVSSIFINYKFFRKSERFIDCYTKAKKLFKFKKSKIKPNKKELLLFSLGFCGKWAIYFVNR